MNVQIVNPANFAHAQCRLYPTILPSHSETVLPTLGRTFRPARQKNSAAGKKFGLLLIFTLFKAVVL
jgi:hypothetical protein